LDQQLFNWEIMTGHLYITGAVLLILSAMHIFFPSRFNWKEELPKLSLLNRQMMQVHTFFIALLLVMIAVLCLVYPDELVNTKFGHVISTGIGIFWLFRLYFQHFVYSRELWRGRGFETVVHIIFSILWVYLSWLFLWIGLML
jgi:hypothetical protein